MMGWHLCMQSPCPICSGWGTSWPLTYSGSLIAAPDPYEEAKRLKAERERREAWDLFERHFLGKVDRPTWGHG